MDKQNLEQRFLNVTDFEIEERENQAPKLVGYAVRYNALSQDLGGFKERFKQHSFARTLDNGPDVLALAQHDDSKVLGRRSAGTLTVTDDAYGIRVSIDPPNTSYSNDLVESIRRKDISGMSFGFIAREENFIKEGETTIREISDADLFEVSIVTNPAYLQSKVNVRSETLAKLEQFNQPEQESDADAESNADQTEQPEAEERFIPSLAMMEKIQKQKELELKLNK